MLTIIWRAIINIIFLSFKNVIIVNRVGITAPLIIVLFLLGGFSLAFLRQFSPLILQVRWLVILLLHFFVRIFLFSWRLIFLVDSFSKSLLTIFELELFPLRAVNFLVVVVVGFDLLGYFWRWLESSRNSGSHATFTSFFIWCSPFSWLITYRLIFLLTFTSAPFLASAARIHVSKRLPHGLHLLLSLPFFILALVPSVLEHGLPLLALRSSIDPDRTFNFISAGAYELRLRLQVIVLVFNTAFLCFKEIFSLFLFLFF